MAKILNIQVEVNDEEFANFLARMAERGTVNGGEETDDNGPANPNAPAVDKNGVPWIEAVHAPSKSMNKDNTWRGKKGVSPELRAQHEAWHKAQMTPPAAPVAPQAPATFTPPAAFLPLAAPQAPAAFLPLAAPQAPAPVTYQNIADRYQALVTGGRITPERFSALYAEIGIVDPSELTTNETARANMMAKLAAFG